MNKKTVIAIVLVNLAALLLLAFVSPHLMVSPGKLMDAHRALHHRLLRLPQPLPGQLSRKVCICHRVDEIGLFTTKGVPIGDEKKNVSFHQKLVEQDCIACHSDHKGVQAFRPIGQFSHELLDPPSATVRRLPPQPRGHPAPEDHGKLPSVPHPAGLDAGHLRPRPVLPLRPRPHHGLQHLPRRQRLRPVHLLRLPRALPLKDPGGARGGGHPRLRELRGVSPQRRQGRGRGAMAFRQREIGGTGALIPVARTHGKANAASTTMTNPERNNGGLVCEALRSLAQDRTQDAMCKGYRRLRSADWRFAHFPNTCVERGHVLIKPGC